MAERPLRGKSALVTGGARRIGREIALELARAGADVAITYLTSQKQAQQTLVDLAGFGVRALALRCDVRDPKSARAAVKEVDVDSDPELVRQFGEQVPVVFIDGKKAFKYRMDERDFLHRLEA